MNKTITISVHPDLDRKLKILARQKYNAGGKVSQLIRDMIENAWVEYLKNRRTADGVRS